MINHATTGGGPLRTRARRGARRPPRARALAGRVRRGDKDGGRHIYGGELLPEPPAHVDAEEQALLEVFQAIEALTFSERPQAASDRPLRPRYARVILAYDGSPGAHLALGFAREFARAHDSRMLVASIFAAPEIASLSAAGLGWYAPYLVEHEAAAHAARQRAEEVARGLESLHIPAETVVGSGSAATEITSIARTHRADIVIAGPSRHGPAARAILGSTVLALADRLPCSLLIARKDTPPRRILVCTDGSHVSHRAVAHALEIASRFGAEVVVQHVIAYPETPEDVPKEGFIRSVMATMKLPAASPKVRYVLDAGEPATRILARAASEACDLIVVGAHGKGRVERFFIGSVSRKVAIHADASVLIVKPPEPAR